MENTVNQEFIKLLDKLKSRFGISAASVSRSTGIERSKISRIRKGNGNASEKLIHAVLTAYPQLTDKESAKSFVEQNKELQKENLELREENEQLKDELLEKQEMVISLQNQLIKYLKTDSPAD